MNFEMINFVRLHKKRPHGSSDIAEGEHAVDKCGAKFDLCGAEQAGKAVDLGMAAYETGFTTGAPKH